MTHVPEPTDPATEIERLRAENERLRKAIETIRDEHTKDGRCCRLCESAGGRWPCGTWLEANAALNPPPEGAQPMTDDTNHEAPNQVRELVREAWSEYASSAKEAIYVAAGLYAIFEAVDLDRQRDDDKIKHAFEALIPAADRHYCRWLGIESADRAAVLTPVDIMRAVGLANKELQELCTRLESEDGPRIPL